MQILHIVPSYKPAYIYGGPVESIARLCEGQAHAGARVDVFTTTANGKTELDVTPDKLYDVDGVNVTYFKRIFKDPFHISPTLWKRLYTECKNYDVVHSHSWWNILVLTAAFICKKRKVKTIISPRGMMSDFIRQHRNRFLKQSMHVVIGKSLLNYMTLHATSEAELKECRRLIKGWKGFVLPNIIWLPHLNISKPANARFTILFLSRIHPKKGIELLMEAVSLMEEKPILKIAGTGDDDYIAQLQQKAKNLGIAGQTEWLGWQDREEKYTALMQADLFALTSYNENFGNVIIEALHAGTPVLVTETTGISGFVAEHQLGWVCSTDVHDIALKLHEAYRDVAYRKRIATCGPVVIHNYLSEEKLIPEYLAQYQAAVSGVA